MASEQTNREWLAEQVAKVPGAKLRDEGPHQLVWAVIYQPDDGGTLAVTWWLRPGSTKEAATVMLMSTHRGLQPEALRHVAALSLAMAAWLDHEPAPQELEL